ncbi:MAG: TolC family protein [Verrucomicrobiae bacterium]|nr:TolC family protein [Verrucomicrobiae bacterium]
MKPIGLLVIGLTLSGLGAKAAEPWRFEDTIQFALTNSPDARVALQRIAAAEAGLRQANAMAWPKLQFQSSYTRTDNPMMVFGSILNQRAFGQPPIGPIDFNNVPDIDNLNIRGVVTMPIYAGGQITAAREAARAYAWAARDAADAVRNTLAFEVARAFHTVLKTREFVRAAEAAVAAFEKNLEIASNRFNAGTLLKADVLDVEVRLAQAREDLVRARNAREIALRALRTLLGIDDPNFDVADTVPAVPVPESGDFSGRPELAASSQQIRAAEAELRRARGGYMPTVGLFGSMDYDRGWRSEGDGKSYTAGVMVQLNVWDGQLTRGKVQQAQAELEAARENDRKLRLMLALEAEQARLNLEEARQRLRVTEKAVALAAESAALTRARFEQGLALAVQLIDAETALTGARVRHAEAQADYRIAIAALRKALGLPQLP